LQAAFSVAKIGTTQYVLFMPCSLHLEYAVRDLRISSSWESTSIATNREPHPTACMTRIDEPSPTATRIEGFEAAATIDAIEYLDAETTSKPRLNQAVRNVLPHRQG
jgi:hypothetical protein